MSGKSPKAAVKSELDKMQDQFDDYSQSIKDLTLDRMNEAPLKEVEPQTKLSQKQIEKSKEIHLKPERSIGDRQKFNEAFRAEWEYEKQYVQFIAEHKELIGENIEIWTHPRGGVPCEFWVVPTNKPVWGPRHLAEQIRRCKYHRLKSQNSVITGSDGMGQYYGGMVVDTIIQRLTAEPVAAGKSVFMGKST